MTWSYRARILAAAIAVGSVSVVAIPLAAAGAISVSIGFDTFHDQLAPLWRLGLQRPLGRSVDSGERAGRFPPLWHQRLLGQHRRIWLDVGLQLRVGRYPVSLRPLGERSRRWLAVDSGLCLESGLGRVAFERPISGWMPMPPDQEFLGYPRRRGRLSGFRSAAGEHLDQFRQYEAITAIRNGMAAAMTRAALPKLGVCRHGAHGRPRHDRRYARSPARQLRNDHPQLAEHHQLHGRQQLHVNRSVDVHAVERASGRRLAPVAARQVMRNPALVTQVSVGRQVQEQARAERPHGDGLANSAPKPAPEIVRTLSTRAIERNRSAPQHLYTQQTVAQAPLPPASANPTPPNAQRPAANAPPAQATPERTPQDRGRSAGRGDRQTPNAAPPTVQAPERPAPTAIAPPTQPTPERAPQNHRGQTRRTRRPPGAERCAAHTTARASRARRRRTADTTNTGAHAARSRQARRARRPPGAKRRAAHTTARASRVRRRHAAANTGARAAESWQTRRARRSPGAKRRAARAATRTSRARRRHASANIGARAARSRQTR